MKSLILEAGMPYYLRSWRFIFLLSYIFLMGCGAAETNQAIATSVSPPQTTNQSGAYPSPAIAYPIPEIIDNGGIISAEGKSSIQLPVSAEGLATLGGVFINQRTGKAPEESIVYLGDIVYTDTGLPIVQLDRQTAPFAILKENGEFVFKDIFPAEYAVIFFTPDISFPIDDAETGQTLILNLQPDDKIDLGIIELPVR